MNGIGCPPKEEYDAGDVVNRAASDVTERNILTGQSAEYQMKAYTSKTNPDLKNTPKNMTVVTNAEKVGVVEQNGYANVEEFQDAEKIKEATNKRLEQIKDGRVQTTYNFKNVAGTMAKAGAIGCVIGMGVETAVSYRSWKNGSLTDEQYLKEILKAGGDAGLTAAGTSGVMIPVSAALTAAGASSLITIPVAFVVSAGLNKIIAPCFGRGDYRKILSQAKYYQNIEWVYEDLIKTMDLNANLYYKFVCAIGLQSETMETVKRADDALDAELKNLYDRI